MRQYGVTALLYGPYSDCGFRLVANRAGNAAQSRLASLQSIARQSPGFNATIWKSPHKWLNSAVFDDCAGLETEQTANAKAEQSANGV